jgi:hypothetical protein
MDGDLYDDKLAGEITKERYSEKHEKFKAQLSELEDQLTNANASSGQQLEERLVIFELSQKASTVYEKKSPEQKRIIIRHLFSKLTSSDDSVNVDYTGFVSVIAHKVRLTRELMEGRQ